MKYIFIDSNMSKFFWILGINCDFSKDPFTIDMTQHNFLAFPFEPARDFIYSIV